MPRRLNENSSSKTHMILEGIVTSLNDEGQLNIAPMGPIVSAQFGSVWLESVRLDSTRIDTAEEDKTLLLRPFQSSTTFQNLSRQRCGVFHVVDNVLLMARAVTKQWDDVPTTFKAKNIEGRILQEACRWFEFEVESIDTSSNRSEMIARVVYSERLRDFFGFNRAKHLVLETIILATRVHLISRAEIEQSLEMYRVPIEKTAGNDERTAFALIESFLQQQWANS